MYWPGQGEGGGGGRSTVNGAWTGPASSSGTRPYPCPASVTGPRVTEVTQSTRPGHGRTIFSSLHLQPLRDRSRQRIGQSSVLHSLQKHVRILTKSSKRMACSVRLVDAEIHRLGLNLHFQSLKMYDSSKPDIRKLIKNRAEKKSLRSS